MLVDGRIVTSGEKRRIHNGLFGVQVYDRKRSDPGYTLFSPSWGDREYLIDMRGLVVHTWPVHHSNVAELHSNGQLFTHNCGNWLEEIAPDGKVDWKWAGEDWMLQPNHHDYAWVSPSEIYSLCSFQEPTKPGMFPEGRAPSEIKTDAIAKVRRDGGIDWKFVFSDHIEALCDLAGLPYPIPYSNPYKVPRIDEDPRVIVTLYGNVGKSCPSDWAHANTIEYLPNTPLGQRDDRFREGNLLFSLRAIDTIGIVDPKKDEIVWAFGPGLLDGQHQPTMLPDGDILIFDNGTYRGYSVVREIEPQSGEVVWEYQDRDTFFSPFRSGNQRLPNGNTLICECDAGRLFEVTREGDTVWDFQNPLIGEGSHHCGRRIHRASRYSPDQVHPLFQRIEDGVHTEIDICGKRVATLVELIESYDA